MAKIGLPENQKIAEEVADKAITLVKNKENIFPISPEDKKRILLVDVKGTQGGFGAMIGENVRPSAKMKELLEAEGFEVSIWEAAEEKIMKMPEEERKAALANVYA